MRQCIEFVSALQLVGLLTSIMVWHHLKLEVGSHRSNCFMRSPFLFHAFYELKTRLFTFST